MMKRTHGSLHKVRFVTDSRGKIRCKTCGQPSLMDLHAGHQKGEYGYCFDTLAANGASAPMSGTPYIILTLFLCYP